MPQFTAADRQAFRAAARAVNDAQLSVPSSARSYRNALTVAILVLAVAALVFPLFAAKADSKLLDLHPAVSGGSSSTPTPGAGSSATPNQTGSGTTSTSSAASTAGAATGYGEIASIELWGVLGGLVGAVAGLRNLRGSSQPVGLQLAQIALKIPAGALTAVVGVVLLQAALTPTTQAVAGGKLAALAIIFGAAQEALTTFVDRTAGNLLDKGKTLGEKTTQAA
ncbi:hypothetical protein EV646_102360 [Kribbella antiqua]|uniref:Uncharacterized protein n=1 Tax=Kribbella antiqua TaxID=2512217 RepID=A0A4R2J0F9_9ACTN|nr:hypothetical protein [Kribbella antiqua]TCO50286.1 hypothetical protein EV646_102360 [Kribbella antiqua]